MGLNWLQLVALGQWYTYLVCGPRYRLVWLGKQYHIHPSNATSKPTYSVCHTAYRVRQKV